MDNRFSVGFTYSPNGSTAMDHLNNVRLSGYEWNLDGKLEPFEVSKNKDMSASAVCYVPLSDEREYSAELRNLAWNTKYYYRFVAMTANDRQSYRGAIKSFTIVNLGLK